MKETINHRNARRLKKIKGIKNN